MALPLAIRSESEVPFVRLANGVDTGVREWEA